MRLVVGREPRELEINQSLLVSGLGRCISCLPDARIRCFEGQGEGPGVCVCVCVRLRDRHRLAFVVAGRIT